MVNVGQANYLQDTEQLGMENRFRTILLMGAILINQASCVTVSANETSKYNQKEPSVSIARYQIIIKGRFGDKESSIKNNEIFKTASKIVGDYPIAVDTEQNIYISDPMGLRIMIFGKNGRFLKSIKFSNSNIKYLVTINDIQIDASDNLYIVSAHERKVYKYNKKGRLSQIIERSADGILLANDGVYLHGFNKLTKHNFKGSVTKSWDVYSEMHYVPFFVDPSDNLYIKEKSKWHIFSRNGDEIGIKECDEMKYSFVSNQEGGCIFPPKYIDKKKNRYYLHRSRKHKVTTIYQVNNDGKLVKQYKTSLKIYPNDLDYMYDFDREGNLYLMEYDEKEYRIVKVFLGRQKP